MAEEVEVKGTKDNTNSPILEQEKFEVVMPGTPGSESNYEQRVREKEKNTD